MQAPHAAQDHHDIPAADSEGGHRLLHGSSGKAKGGRKLIIYLMVPARDTRGISTSASKTSCCVIFFPRLAST